MAARIHADFQGWALRLAALVLAGFFLATWVMPLETVGDPAFDIPVLRSRWYHEWGLIWLQGGLVLALIWQVARRPGWAVAAALAATATAMVLMLAEEGQLIQYGSLILPHDAAMTRLNVNRFGTAALSVVAVLALWRFDARH